MLYGMFSLFRQSSWRIRSEHEQTEVGNATDVQFFFLRARA